MNAIRMLLCAALGLPATVMATAAADPQQAIETPHELTTAHRQLFTVKFVLRPASPEEPAVVMDDHGAQIVPPLGTGFPSVLLGTAAHDPNTIVCYGWGCESQQR